MPVTLDIFWLVFVNVSEWIASLRLNVQQLVQLGMHRLSVAVFGALDQQRHEPRRQNCKAMQPEVLAIEKEP
jgi:hypothetical protein